MVDSLLTVLKNHNAVKTELRINLPSLYDSTAADILTRLAAVYTTHNNNTAMQYAQEGLDLSEAIGYKQGAGNAHQKKGWIYLNEDNYSEALKSLDEALRINLETGDRYETYGCYFAMGHTYLGKGNLPEALKNYFEALKIAEAAGNKKQESIAIAGIVNVYSSMGNYTESKKYILRSIKINEPAGDKTLLGESYDSMAELNNGGKGL